ncbi:AAA family ATPase [Rahnella perminowiae]|nr:AAA family ATPase [Rahnella perminowiae]
MHGKQKLHFVIMSADNAMKIYDEKGFKMELIKLEVKGLFGLLNYDIPLNNSDFTILTGPNGYGKTILLRVIRSILKNELEMFKTLKFESFTLLTDIAEIEIIKDFSKNNNESVYLKLSRDGTVHEESIAFPAEKIISAGKNKVTITTPKFSDNIFLKFLNENNDSLKVKTVNNENCYSQVLSDFFVKPEVTFIKAQRLENRESHNAVIDDYAGKLITLMEEANVESAKISQRLDTTFPSRLFDMIGNSQAPSSASIKDRLIGIQNKRKEYIKFGLIQSEEDNLPVTYGNFINGNEYLNVLKLYIDDGIEKLAPFESLYSKINLFSNLLKEKTLAFKKVVFSREEGFGFESNSGDDIGRNSLSSGEQNQVVMLFDLIFNSENYSVILIDEPEISLHVAWQKEFLNSLKKIQKINESSKYIIATHSTYVIDNKWELTYDLFEATKGIVK